MKTKTADVVADAVGALYREFFKLREAGDVQEEYDCMGTLIKMLQQDRETIRRTYEVRD